MNILIVDDDQMLCESLKLILSMEEGIDVIGTANNGDKAFDFCRENIVDLILMDIRMPICDGVIGTKKIKEIYPNIKIIILTTFNDDHYIVKAIQYGASAYLLKTVKPKKIIETIKLVYEGNILLHSEIADKVKNLITDVNKMDFSKYNLTKNHIKIMELVSKGLNNKEIASKLYLSEGTIKNKISEILLELGLRDRTQLAIFYHKAGNVNFPH